jgi:hypothetical protein
MSPTDDYYRILPRIFYQLYTTAKNGKQLNMKQLFKEYPNLSSTTKAFLLNKKTYEPIATDNANITKVIQSVVDLFNMIKLEFPKLYQDITSKVSPPVAFSKDDFINRIKAHLATMTELSEADKTSLLDNLVAAHMAYGVGDFTKATDEIINCLGIVSGIIKAVTTKVSELTENYTALETYRINRLEGKATANDSTLTAVTDTLSTLEPYLAKDNTIKELIAKEEELNEAIEKKIEVCATATTSKTTGTGTATSTSAPTTTGATTGTSPGTGSGSDSHDQDNRIISILANALDEASTREDRFRETLDNIMNDARARELEAQERFLLIMNMAREREDEANHRLEDQQEAADRAADRLENASNLSADLVRDNLALLTQKFLKNEPPE